MPNDLLSHPPAENWATQVRDHARGAMVGMAIGDALGATVEFMTPREIRVQFGCHRQIIGAGWLHLAPGQVTDDTTMAFALADAWLADGAPPTAQACARAFDLWMKSKPVDVGHTVRRGIIHFRNSGEACVPSSDEAGNGATMRCAPVAIAMLGATSEAVGHETLSQARVTHHNRLTDAASIAVVRMIQQGIDGAGIRGVMALANQLVRDFPIFHFRGKLMENPSGYVVDTLRAVLQAIDLNDNFESVLVDVVNRGGDADTTGAIAGAIMGGLTGEVALPRQWVRALNATVYNRCLDYADRLAMRSPAWQTHSGHH
jgi:ADP-ribosyl-[dinitrogen reductase] hydrolase